MKYKYLATPLLGIGYLASFYMLISAFLKPMVARADEFGCYQLTNCHHNGVSGGVCDWMKNDHYYCACFYETVGGLMSCGTYECQEGH